MTDSFLPTMTTKGSRKIVNRSPGGNQKKISGPSNTLIVRLIITLKLLYGSMSIQRS